MYHSELLCTKSFNTLPITNYLLIHALLLNIVPKFVQAYAKSGYRLFHTTVEEVYCLLSKSSIPILSVFPLAETISLCWELSFCIKKTYDGMTPHLSGFWIYSDIINTYSTRNRLTLHVTNDYIYVRVYRCVVNAHIRIFSFLLSEDYIYFSKTPCVINRCWRHFSQ